MLADQFPESESLVQLPNRSSHRLRDVRWKSTFTEPLKLRMARLGVGLHDRGPFGLPTS